MALATTTVSSGYCESSVTIKRLVSESSASVCVCVYVRDAGSMGLKTEADPGSQVSVSGSLSSPGKCGMQLLKSSLKT